MMHPAFRKPLYQDVTAVYADSLNRDLVVSSDILCKEVHKGDIVYFCLSTRMDWVPKSQNSGNLKYKVISSFSL